MSRVSESVRDSEISDMLNWSKDMWPLSPVILKKLPDELLPTIDQLNSLKYPWELLQLIINYMIQTQITELRISPEANISQLVSIEGPVWIEKGVKIADFVKVVGPAFIGQDTFIGNFSLIRSSFIADQCVVGAHSEITRSIVGSSCTLHRNYIGDSVLSDNVDFGGNSATANLRLDNAPIKSKIGGNMLDTGLVKLGSIIGQETQIAGGCITMPGVKVGNRCTIMPGVRLYEDLPDNMNIKLVQEQVFTGTK